MPELHVQADYETMSAAAADRVEARLRENPRSLLCLATGSTPTRTYEIIAKKSRNVFNSARVIKLDEWGGIPLSSPSTCEAYLRRLIIDPLGLAPRFVGFESEPLDPSAECQRIAAWLDQYGPIDLCVLGLGINGHLGFNEPAAAFTPHAHLATLSPESLQHSMIENLSAKPTYGLTLGIEDILASREILLLVSGSAKANPLFRMLHDDIGPSFPATCLRNHQNTRILCDRAAAQKIS